jgi:hypothetical protein
LLVMNELIMMSMLTGQCVTLAAAACTETCSGGFIARWLLALAAVRGPVLFHAIASLASVDKLLVFQW